jgi:hypothetical protein
MTRMSKEFTLVLLGSGVLTAGYFTVPAAEEEMEKKAEEQAAHRTGHSSSTYHSHYRTGGLFLWVHSPGYAGHATGRPAAYSATTRSGGFGGISRGFSGGGA